MPSHLCLLPLLITTLVLFLLAVLPISTVTIDTKNRSRSIGQRSVTNLSDGTIEWYRRRRRRKGPVAKLTPSFSSLPEKPYQLMVQARRKAQNQHKEPWESAPHQSSDSVQFPSRSMDGAGGAWDHSQESRTDRLGEIGGDQISGKGEAAEHKIAHLTSRPTQLYYYTQQQQQQRAEEEAEGEANGGPPMVELGVGQVCRVKVPAADVFYIAYEDADGGGHGGAGAHHRFIDLFFHCSQYWAWCCGVDCCQLDPTLLFTGLCVLVVLCALCVHCCVRSEFGQRLCAHRLFRVRRRHKRVIARANAQRRRTSSGAGKPDPTPTVAKRSGAETVKNGAETRSGNYRKTLRNTLGRAPRRLISLKSGMKKAWSVPQIVITEPSSCYEPSMEEAEDEEEEEEEE